MRIFYGGGGKDFYLGSPQIFIEKDQVGGGSVIGNFL